MTPEEENEMADLADELFAEAAQYLRVGIDCTRCGGHASELHCDDEGFIYCKGCLQ